MRKIKIIILFILSFYSFILYPSDYKSQTVDKSVTVFAIALPANPSTGYQWTLVHFDGSFLAFVKSGYVRPITNQMGASGLMVFTFILKPGKQYPPKTTMEFKLARPWEAGKGEIQSVEVEFK